MTERLRETAFLAESSAGACLDGRTKSRWSFLPARRSRASENAGSLARSGWRVLVGVVVVVEEEGWGGWASVGSVLLGLLRLPRTDWALTRAPKEMFARSSLGGASVAYKDFRQLGRKREHG